VIEIKLNGERVSLDADPAMPLLYAIRDIAQLTGTKFGCGIGLCGACTVHLDGQAIRACVTPLSAATDKEITTIEGLSKPLNSSAVATGLKVEAGMHPVQQAWFDNKVPQCGYCQPGQMMSFVVAVPIHELERQLSRPPKHCRPVKANQ